jgi:glutamate dehydrogenase
VNDLVNFAGITFYHRLNGETSASAEELARANLVCRETFQAIALIERINSLDNQIDAAVQTDMRLSVRTLIERATRWIVNNRRAPLDSAAVIDYFRDGIGVVVKMLPSVLKGMQLDEFTTRRDELMARNVPEDVAVDVAVLPFAYAALEIVEISTRDGVDATVTAELHALLSDRLGLSQFADKIWALPRDDRWQTMARASLRDDFHAVHADLTAKVLATTNDDDTPEQRVAAWEAGDELVIERATTTLKEILDDEAADLARLSVGLRVIRTMLATP